MIFEFPIDLLQQELTVKPIAKTVSTAVLRIFHPNLLLYQARYTV